MTSAEHLSSILSKLAGCEQEMGEAEREAEIFRINKTQALYAKRRALLKDIPQFWYIILAENDDFAEYIRLEDLKYLDFIDDIYVHHHVTDGSHEGGSYRDFSITISFKDTGDTVPTQTVTKRFWAGVEGGEESLTSENAPVQWPSELASICPQSVRQNKDGAYSTEEKKRYRQGMKSLFAWFEWTGKKPGKEFKGGEDLARLILDDIFPNAVRYYVEAMNNSQEESDVDTSEGEQLDVSGDEEPERKKSKTE